MEGCFGVKIKEAIEVFGPIRAARLHRRRWCPKAKRHYIYMLDGHLVSYATLMREAQKKRAAEERQNKRRDIGET